MEHLLIIGSGGHGKVVAEVAEACGCNGIFFLDDDNNEAIGRTNQIKQFITMFEFAFVGIGNNRLRAELMERLELAGYKIPTLLHPTAYISKTAVIHSGTVVEPGAIVNAHAVIKAGCIISAGAIIDHDAIVGDFCHINSGAIVKAGGTVSDYEKLEAGEVRRGY